MRIRRLLPLLLLGAAWMAQAAPGQTLEQRVEVLERRVKALSELVLRMDRLQREVQQLRGEIEVQNHAVDALKQRQRDLYLDLDRRLSQGGSVAPPKAAPAASPASAPTSGPTPPTTPAAPAGAVQRPVTQASEAEQEQAYQKAYGLLRERRYDEAKRALRDYLKRYPGGSFADNAQYWLAEASYVTRDYDSALADFQTLLKQYPDSPKAPGGMLKIGYILFDKGRLPEAKEMLTSVVERHPGSSAARLAQAFMRKKGL